MAKNKKGKKRTRRRKGGSSFIGERVRTISGQQVYATVVNGANGTKLFNTQNAIAVSPDSFGTEIADIANHFNQYRFTRLVFEFVPSLYNVTTEGPTGSQSNNLFAFGFEADGEVTFTVTHSAISQLQHAIITPATGFKNRRDNMLRTVLKDRWYYTEDVTTDSATIRWTIQGILYGEALTTIVSSTTYGEIWVHYTVQFRDLCPNQGVTVHQLLREFHLGKTDRWEGVIRSLQHLCGECSADELSNEELKLLTGHGRKPALAWAPDDGKSDVISLNDDPAIIEKLAQLLRLAKQPP